MGHSQRHTQPAQTELPGMKLVQLLVLGIPGTVDFFLSAAPVALRAQQESALGELYLMARRMSRAYPAQPRATPPTLYR